MKYKQSFILLFILTLAGSASGSDEVVVISPNLNNQYNKVVKLVVGGINNQLKDIEHVVYQGNAIIPETNSIILTSKAKRKIESESKNSTLNHVFGLLELSKNEDVYGVSLFINAGIYIKEILTLNPKINRVVFFNDERRGVTQNKSELQSTFNIGVESHGASTLSQAIDIFSTAHGKSTQETAMVFTRGFIEFNEDTMLDLILSKTWNTKILTVTNKPLFVKRGVVLGVAPDLEKYGEQIAELYDTARSDEFANPSVEYLNRFISAINERTLRHTGVDLSHRKKKTYNLIYSGN